MSDISEARRILHLMPPDVFDMYIEPIVRLIGWPFGSESDSTLGTEWVKVFDHQPIDVIANLQWTLRSLPWSLIRFTPGAKKTIDTLIDSHVNGISTPLSNIDGGREKFLKFLEFSREHGRIPAPAVLMSDHGEFRLLDGNHRVAAFSHLPNVFALTLDAWVGRLESDDTVAPSQVGDPAAEEKQLLWHKLNALREGSSQHEKPLKRIKGRDLARKPEDEI